MHLNKVLAFLLIVALYSPTQAQDNSSKFSAFEGVVVMGYVDHGAYLNFTGPNVKWTQGNAVTTLGMLPSLRIKQDVGTTQHSLITPNLGIGITCEYKGLVLQIPLYYNPKNSEINGNWNVGFGFGFRM